jgi:hypothetical protein
MRHTHTFAVLEVSQAAYDEIAAKLKAADYGYCFLGSDGVPVIDMGGIALQAEAPAVMSVTDQPAKPPSGLWRNDPATPEGKYLVKRRDGTVPEWPNFVIGAKDPAAPAAIRGYANKARALGFNEQYCNDVLALAERFEEYRLDHGDGDPDRGRHRVDDPATIAEMRGGKTA